VEANSSAAIEILPGASRGLRILQPDGLPIVGRVAAGAPILAEQHIETHCRVDSALFKPRAHYFLRVRGLSMRDAGILDGDLLAVHKTPDVRTGQVVVARVNDEVTVKRLRRRGNQMQLLPENPDFAPIEIDPRKDRLVIEGLGVGVLRHGKSL
jgi:repressor LexA